MTQWQYDTIKNSPYYIPTNWIPPLFSPPPDIDLRPRLRNTRNHEMFLAEFFPPDFWHSSQIIEIWLFPFRGIGRWEFKDVGGHNLETGSLLCCLDNWRHLQWFTGWKGFIIGGSFEIRKVIVGEWKWFRGFPLINLGTDCLVCLKIANPHNYIEHWELQIRFELEWFISYTLVEKTFNIWSSSHPFT